MGQESSSFHSLVKVSQYIFVVMQINIEWISLYQYAQAM